MSNPNEKQERRRVMIIATVMMLCMIGGGIGSAFYLLRPSIEFNEVTLELPPKFTQTQNDFVGSAKCAECHAEVAKKYAQSGKAHSLVAIHSAKEIEKYDGQPITTDGPQEFLVEKVDGEIVHRERMADEGPADWLYNEGESIDYVLGSGRRSRGYLLQRGSVLLQSPITWEVSANKFTVSESAANAHFDSTMTDNCLRCHAGRVAPRGKHLDLYETPAFLESAVSCENCHGPGGQHVAKQEKQKTEGPDDTILNPKKLGSRRQNHLCASCHLHGLHTIARHGATLLDYRPGMMLEEVIPTLAPVPASDAEFDAADQVMQMRGSACYIKSSGKLTCITCHDAHSEPAKEERASFYAAKCNQCHSEKPCTEDEQRRTAAPAAGSCVHCHMPKQEQAPAPHVSWTDHRIRVPSEETTTGEVTYSLNRLRIFDDGESRLPPIATKRIKALTHMKEAARRQDPNLARKAGMDILPRGVAVSEGVAALADDTPSLTALGEMFMFESRPEQALLCWEQLLKSEPDSVSAMVWMVRHHFEQQQPNEVIDFTGRIIERNPYFALAHAHRALALGMVKRTNEATLAAKETIRLNPTMVEMHRWLADAYDDAKQPELAKRHTEIADALEKAGYVDQAPER